MISAILSRFRRQRRGDTHEPLKFVNTIRESIEKSLVQIRNLSTSELELQKLDEGLESLAAVLREVDKKEGLVYQNTAKIDETTFDVVNESCKKAGRIVTEISKEVETYKEEGRNTNEDARSLQYSTDRETRYHYLLGKQFMADKLFITFRETIATLVEGSSWYTEVRGEITKKSDVIDGRRAPIGINT